MGQYLWRSSQKPPAQIGRKKYQESAFWVKLIKFREKEIFSMKSTDTFKLLFIMGAIALLMTACAAPEYDSGRSYDSGQSYESGRNDAIVPGTDYHATGSIPCSMGQGQPTGSCPFGVRREGNGSGMVTVTKPDGSARTIFFENGRAVGYDQSQADTGRFRYVKESDLNIIHIGTERYEIPDAVIFGG
jgi:hypothetical protein